MPERNIEGYTSLLDRVYLISPNGRYPVRKLTPEEILQNQQFTHKLDEIKLDPESLNALLDDIEKRFRLLTPRQRYVLDAKFRLSEPGEPFRSVAKIANEFKPLPVSKSYVYELWNRAISRIVGSAIKEPIHGLIHPLSIVAKRTRELNELEVKISLRAPEVAEMLPEKLREAALRDIEENKTQEGQINPLELDYSFIKLVESYIFYSDAVNARQT